MAGQTAVADVPGVGTDRPDSAGGGSAGADFDASLSETAARRAGNRSSSNDAVDSRGHDVGSRAGADETGERKRERERADSVAHRARRHVFDSAHRSGNAGRAGEAPQGDLQEAERADRKGQKAGDDNGEAESKTSLEQGMRSALPLAAAASSVPHAVAHHHEAPSTPAGADTSDDPVRAANARLLNLAELAASRGMKDQRQAEHAEKAESPADRQVIKIVRQEAHFAVGRPHNANPGIQDATQLAEARTTVRAGEPSPHGNGTDTPTSEKDARGPRTTLVDTHFGARSAAEHGARPDGGDTRRESHERSGRERMSVAKDRAPDAVSSKAAVASADGVLSQAGSPLGVAGTQVFNAIVDQAASGSAGRSAPSINPEMMEDGYRPGQFLKVIKLQLSPASLGLVHVELAASDSSLRVRLEADLAQTAGSLEKDRGELMSRLTASGYNLDELVISRTSPADGTAARPVPGHDPSASNGASRADGWNGSEQMSRGERQPGGGHAGARSREEEGGNVAPQPQLDQPDRGSRTVGDLFLRRRSVGTV
ncbi:MAG: flagellar hook-length control protein FliK [Hyphomicrobiaceae bacterium]